MGATFNLRGWTATVPVYSASGGVASSENDH